MNDKHGNAFKDLLKIQETHLANWHPRLEPKLFDGVLLYVRKHREEALDHTKEHRAYRGQDLVQIIQTWPDLPSYYPPAVDAQDLV